VDKSSFLLAVRVDHARWQTALDALGRSRMLEPIVGEWTGKDLVAHVTWLEREMVGLMHERALAGSELWLLDTDAGNAIAFEQNRLRPLDEVLADAETVHTQLLEELESLPEEHYGNPARFRDMPPDWLPWRVFAGNTYLHYREHADDVEQWLRGTGSVG
jgi:hypothetical protein